MGGAGIARGAGMHSVFFGVKRAYWRGISLQTRLLVEVDTWITPARFDLLRVLFVNRAGVSRYRLKLMLGVSGPVLSRMVRVLEEEGLLVRRRSDRDRRYVSVHPTPEGLLLVEDALRELRDDGLLETWVRRCFASSDERWQGEVELLERFLERARVALEDPTPRRHPWEGISISRDGWILELEMPPPTAASIAELRLAA